MKPIVLFRKALTFNLKPLTIVFERSNAMKTKVFVLGLFLAVFFLVSLSYAQEMEMIGMPGYAPVPQKINYQGKITIDGQIPPNQNYSMTFSIYDALTEGTQLWTENQTVYVENGVFSVLLGDFTLIPFGVFNGDTRYLQVTVNGTPLTPRKEMVSVPYALRSSGRFTCPADSLSYIWLDPNTGGSCNSVGILMNEHRNHNYVSLAAYDESYGNYIGTVDPAAGYGQGFGIVGGPNVAPFERFVVNTDSMFLGYCKKAGNGSSAGGGNGGGNLFVRGNVGIKTTSPGADLDVWGDTVIIGDNLYGSCLWFRNDAGNREGKITQVQNAWSFEGSYVMHLNPGGWVQVDKNLIAVGQVKIPNMSTSTGTAVSIDGNGWLVKQSSSRRYKENIRKLEVDPEKVLQLEPVKFAWKTTGQEDVGLIAEDVETVIPDLVIYDKEGQPDAVKYDKVAIYLLQLVKAQQEKISALEKQIAELRK